DEPERDLLAQVLQSDAVVAGQGGIGAGGGQGGQQPLAGGDGQQAVGQVVQRDVANLVVEQEAGEHHGADTDEAPDDIAPLHWLGLHGVLVYEENDQLRVGNPSASFEEKGRRAVSPSQAACSTAAGAGDVTMCFARTWFIATHTPCRWPVPGSCPGAPGDPGPDGAGCSPGGSRPRWIPVPRPGRKSVAAGGAPGRGPRAPGPVRCDDLPHAGPRRDRAGTGSRAGRESRSRRPGA